MGTCFSRGDQCREEMRPGSKRRLTGWVRETWRERSAKVRTGRWAPTSPQGQWGRRKDLIHAVERSLQPFRDDNHSGTDGRGLPTQGTREEPTVVVQEREDDDDHASLLLALVGMSGPSPSGQGGQRVPSRSLERVGWLDVEELSWGVPSLEISREGPCDLLRASTFSFV